MDQELRRRHPDEKGDPDSEAADSDVVAEGADSEPEDLAKSGGRGTEGTPEVLDGALASLPPRWRNWVIRGIFTWVMIIGFGWIVYVGPLALMAVVLIVQVKCFSEIINIGYAVYRIHGLPWFRSLSWWFLLCSNYFLYGESLVDYFIVIVNRLEFLRVLVTCHRMISFGLYIVGFVWFVLSLVKKYYMKQFSLFAWTHVALLIVVTQSYLIIQNIFEGMIWLIVPVSMIIINDVMAYIFGFFFGRTPLIQLSPKKTWEGFIGGGVATVFIGLLMSQQLAQYAYFTCPLEYSESLDGFSFACQRPPQFVPQQFALPAWVAAVCRLFGMPPTLEFSPFLLHALVMGLFSSIIGPFGGFFASGFKRAFKIKDFGDLIPGHGGIMDRFDCQFLMATFVNVYIFTFVRSPSTHKILQQVYTLKPDQQVHLYSMLRDGLAARGLLG